MIENADRKPVIGMCQGPKLILLCDGRSIEINVGCWSYAADLAAAINELASPADEATDD